ncbi:DMT family transporter [Nordella sp. HKS 07]|uniref:DMT family transporter n=1 Tax=Nordella sp. HKS 07 TaxID=2712222 RepID=UPI0013E1ABC7|nr:DMT family transporter [Nordella sp. HKS 07]QIG51383.1 DMT family transporter [Nordella sp. HKS 07]
MSFFTGNRNLLGIASLCAGILIISTQDAIIKAVSGDYAVTQAVATRSIVALPILLLFVHWDGGMRQILSPRFWALTFRGLILLVAYTSYYLAFPALPLAEAIVLFFTAPFLVTFLAAPILGEKVELKAIIALVVGFAGVLVIMNPGFGFFEPAALFSLLSAITYALAMLFARKLGVSEPASVMAFYQNWVYLAGAGLMALVFHLAGITTAEHPSIAFLVRPWSWPDSLSLAMMAACGGIAAISMVLLTQAYRMADASLVTVFEYTGMIWAPLWGFLFFAEVPAASTLLGMLLILAAGLIVLVRPRQPQLAGEP